MDTLETYIKMCDCLEIQEGHKWEYGDWLIAEHGVFQIGTASFHYDISDEQKPPIRSELPTATIQNHENLEDAVFLGDIIWLPCQDQIQEMISEHWGERDCENWFVVVLDEFQDFVLNKCPNGLIKMTSMEQLWLAFYMKEKFNKTWDGEKWI